MPTEAHARTHIDALLQQAGWGVCDLVHANLGVARADRPGCAGPQCQWEGGLGLGQVLIRGMARIQLIKCTKATLCIERVRLGVNPNG